MTQTALITGATEGIGRAIAHTLGKAGYAIGVCARTPSRLRILLDELATAGITAAGFPGDVGIEYDAARIHEHISGALGPVDVLVNNAGIAPFRRFDELTVEEWDACMATNVRSLFLMTRTVLPGMRQRKHGAIVNIVSLSGKNGFAGGSVYAASKHAALGFSKSLMLEVRKDNIRVIAICPGSVDTPMMRQEGAPKTDPAKILRPEDVAATVLAALALPERAMISELDLRPTNP
jgi:3-oxoacyl-[acyl-carrier protein] reductase